MTKIHATRKRLLLKLYVAPLLLVLALSWQTIVAKICLNVAQLARIQGKEITSLYLRAYHFAPNDIHIRWQTAEALSRVGRYQEAVDILKSTSPENAGSYLKLVQASLVENLIQLGKVHEAWSYFSSTVEPIPLDPRAAAQLWLAILDRLISVEDITERRLDQLIITALANFIVTNNLEPILEKIKEPSFWQKPEGKHLRSVLEYKAQICCSHSSWGDTDSLKKQSPKIDVQFIANSLGIPKDNIQLGKELLKNAEFEVADYHSINPLRWFSYFDPYNSYSLLIFSTHKGKVRIDSIIMENNSRDKHTGGISYEPTFVERDKSYVISITYCTSSQPNTSQEATASALEYGLGSTNGKWRNVYIVNWRPTNSNVTRRLIKRGGIITPSIYVLRQGTVWVDKFSIREIFLPRGSYYSLKDKEEILIQETKETC